MSVSMQLMERDPMWVLEDETSEILQFVTSSCKKKNKNLWNMGQEVEKAED